MVGFVVPKDVKQQLGVALQVFHLNSFIGVSGKDQSADHSDIPEFPPGHFRGVQAFLKVLHEILRREKIVVQDHLHVEFPVREQLEPVVIIGKGKGDRRQKADPVAQQTRHGLMHKPPFKRIEKVMETLPCLEGFYEEFTGARYDALPLLPLEKRGKALDLDGLPLSGQGSRIEFLPKQF